MKAMVTYCTNTAVWNSGLSGLCGDPADHFSECKTIILAPGNKYGPFFHMSPDGCEWSLKNSPFGKWFIAEEPRSARHAQELMGVDYLGPVTEFYNVPRSVLILVHGTPKNGKCPHYIFFNKTRPDIVIVWEDIFSNA